MVLSLAPLVLCGGGVPPLPPCGGRLRPRGRPSVARPPAGPLARAPCARWPTSRPTAVVDVRCRLARYLLGCAVPNVSCGRLFSGCALGLGLAPVTSLFPGWALRPGPIGPWCAPGALPPPRPGYALAVAPSAPRLCSGGVAPSATYLCSVKASAFHTLFCMVPYGLAFKSFTRRATIEKNIAYLNQYFI